MAKNLKDGYQQAIRETGEVGKTFIQVGQGNSFFFDISRGEFGNFDFISQFGGNPNISIANEEDVWAAGGTWVPSDTATVVSIVSDNANDAAGGLGARTLRIEGLDANYDPQQEDVTLNGTTTVTTINTFLRINRATVLTAGANGANDGDIDMTINGTTHSYISSGVNRSSQAIFTTANNQRGYLYQAEASIIGAEKSFGVKEGTLRISARPENQTFQALGDIGINSRSSFFQFNRIVPLRVAEKTDIKWTFNSYTNDSQINVSFLIILEDVS